MGFMNSLTVDTGNRRLRINLAETDRIEAVEGGVRLYWSDRTFVHGSSLSALLELLDPSQFIQLSSSTVVNLDRVEEFTVLPTGDFTITLRDGTTLQANGAAAEQLATANRGSVH